MSCKDYNKKIVAKGPCCPGCNNPQHNPSSKMKEMEAALKEKDAEIARLRRALKDIEEKSYCQCEPEDTFDGVAS